MILFCVDIHLTFVALELQSEAASVGELQRERFFPFRVLAAAPDTIAETVAQTMAALHDERFLRLLYLEG